MKRSFSVRIFISNVSIQLKPVWNVYVAVVAYVNDNRSIFPWHTFAEIYASLLDMLDKPRQLQICYRKPVAFKYIINYNHCWPPYYDDSSVNGKYLKMTRNNIKIINQ